jgi:hypothetical protein
LFLYLVLDVGSGRRGIDTLALELTARYQRAATASECGRAARVASLADVFDGPCAGLADQESSLIVGASKLAILAAGRDTGTGAPIRNGRCERD